MTRELVLGLYVFGLAVIVGFEVISRVPSALHTPLMSATNAIHGVVVLGAILVAGSALTTTGHVLGFIALLFGAANVYFRDAENLVDLLLMVATWASPVLYGWTQVRAALGPTFTFFYLMNPITIAVECFHYAFWFPTTDGTAELPPNLLTIWLPAGLVMALLTVMAGQLTFRRLEGRFAQEL